VVDRGQLSRDGSKVYYLVPDGGGSRAGTVIEHDIATGAKREVFRKPDDTGAAVLSPDGRWFAVVREPGIDRENPATTKSTVFLFSVDGGARRDVTIPGGAEAFFGFDWMPDSKALLIPGGSPDAALWLVPVSGGEPRKLDINIRSWITPYGIRVAPDGKQIAFFTGESRNEVWALEKVIPAAVN
jgi:Tol biopolymer transport system component